MLLKIINLPCVLFLYMCFASDNFSSRFNAVNVSWGETQVPP